MVLKSNNIVGVKVKSFARLFNARSWPSNLRFIYIFKSVKKKLKIFSNKIFKDTFKTELSLIKNTNDILHKLMKQLKKTNNGKSTKQVRISIPYWWYDKLFSRQVTMKSSNLSRNKNHLKIVFVKLWYFKNKSFSEYKLKFFHYLTTHGEIRRTIQYYVI